MTADNDITAMMAGRTGVAYAEPGGSQPNESAAYSPIAMARQTAQIRQLRHISKVQAVFRNEGFPPFGLWMMACRNPVSAHSETIPWIVIAMAIMPKASGARRRVITKLPRRRRNCAIT